MAFFTGGRGENDDGFLGGRGGLDGWNFGNLGGVGGGGFFAGGADPFAGGGAGLGFGIGADPNAGGDWFGGMLGGMMAGGVQEPNILGGAGNQFNPAANPLAGGGLQNAFFQNAMRDRNNLPTNYGNNGMMFVPKMGGYGGGGYGGGGGGPPVQLQSQNAAYNYAMAGGRPSGGGYQFGQPFMAGGGNNQMASDLYQKFQKAHDEAKGANEQRYGDILNDRRRLESDMNNMASSTSGQERLDINDRYDRSNADTIQSATDRGLGNTTVLDSLQRGVNADRTAALNRQSDQAVQRQMGVRNAGAEQRLGFMERRTDAYPSYEMMAQLAMQAGQGGGGMGGGGVAGGAAGGSAGGGGALTNYGVGTRGPSNVGGMILGYKDGPNGPVPVKTMSELNAARYNAQWEMNKMKG